MITTMIEIILAPIAILAALAMMSVTFLVAVFILTVVIAIVKTTIDKIRGESDE